MCLPGLFSSSLASALGSVGERYCATQLVLCPTRQRHRMEIPKMFCAGRKKHMKCEDMHHPQTMSVMKLLLPSAAAVRGPSTYKGHSSGAAQTVLCLLPLSLPSSTASTTVGNSHYNDRFF